MELLAVIHAGCWISACNNQWQRWGIRAKKKKKNRQKKATSKTTTTTNPKKKKAWRCEVTPLFDMKEG